MPGYVAPMTSRLVSLTFDADDPLRLATFWAEVLGWALGDVTPDEVDVVPTDGTGFGLVFVPVPEQKAGKNRIHVDVTTTSADDQERTVARLLELGARNVDIGQGDDERHVVLADPEGNELCIIEPGNRFLEGCGLVGAVSCDGSHAAGLFWRDALGWPLVWDEGEETAIQSPRGGPKISWGGPPLLPKHGTRRWRFDLASEAGNDVESEAARLVGLGAARLGTDEHGVLIADPDGHEHRLLPSR